MLSRHHIRFAALLLAAAAVLLAAACSGSETPAPATPQASVVALAEGLTPAQSGFAHANGARLYYEVYGEGEPLLLIMGLGANHLSWTAQIPVYAREFQVIVFDNPGTGQSDIPEGVDYTIPLLADDAAALLDALGIDAAHVYGVSMGGMIAQEMALRHPDKVSSLILGATTPGGAHAVSPSAEGLRALIDQGAAIDRVVNPAILEVLFSPAYLAEHASELRDKFQRLADYPATSPEAYAAQLRAVARHDTYDRLPEIAAPTLVLHGTDDPLLPVANARILAERIPGAKLVLFEAARHGYMIEKQADADAAVLDFLSAHAQEVAADRWTVGRAERVHVLELEAGGRLE
jgi:pimeloyl-ACP methyl ester carboxylesterase